MEHALRLSHGHDTHLSGEMPEDDSAVADRRRLGALGVPFASRHRLLEFVHGKVPRLVQERVWVAGMTLDKPVATWQEAMMP